MTASYYKYENELAEAEKKCKRTSGYKPSQSCRFCKNCREINRGSHYDYFCKKLPATISPNYICDLYEPR